MACSSVDQEVTYAPAFASVTERCLHHRSYYGLPSPQYPEALPPVALSFVTLETVNCRVALME